MGIAAELDIIHLDHAISSESDADSIQLPPVDLGQLGVPPLLQAVLVGGFSLNRKLYHV